MSARAPSAPESASHLLQAQYRQALAPVTEALLRSAAIRAGQRVLEVGSGSGDLAALAAQAVGPTGSVLATDASADAMQGLVDRLHVLPCADRIAMTIAAAEELELELAPGSFDAALARNCVMYFRDLPRAFMNVHAALRPGGRFALSVYGPLEHEPFHSIPIAAVRSRRQIHEPYPEYVQAFRVGSADVEQALLDAGFASVEPRVVAVERAFPSTADAVDSLRLSRSLGQLLSLLPPEQVEHAWVDITAGFREYASAAGMRLPGEQVVIVATR